MYSKSAIEKTIQNTIKDVTGIAALEKDASLIDRELDIHPAKFLYIFDILERELMIPVHEVFTTQSFDVMTIGNLTDAILELESQNRAEVAL